MKPQIRAIVAYIAGEIVNQRGAVQVIDFSDGRTYKFSGRIKDGDVDVEEGRTGTQFSGGCFGGKYSLTNFADSSQIEIEPKGKSFNGHDFKTGRKFQGKVEGSTVTFFDEATRGHYAYSIK